MTALVEFVNVVKTFGGVHAVSRDPDGRVTAAADVRRGGAVAVV